MRIASLLLKYCKLNLPVAGVLYALCILGFLIVPCLPDLLYTFTYGPYFSLLHDKVLERSLKQQEIASEDLEKLNRHFRRNDYLELEFADTIWLRQRGEQALARQESKEVLSLFEQLESGFHAAIPESARLDTVWGIFCCFDHLGDTESAKAALKQMILLLEEFQSRQPLPQFVPFFQAMVWGVQAGYALQEEDFETAEFYSRKRLQYFNEIDDPEAAFEEERAVAMGNLAFVLAARKQYGEAIRYLEAAIPKLQLLNKTEALRRYQKKLAEIIELHEKTIQLP